MAVIGNEKYTKRIEKYLSKYPDKRSAVMPLLYIAQEEYGWVTEDALREVAQLCEMDATQVKSIAGFYTMYRERPSGKHWVYVCTDLACALEGGDDLYEGILDELGLDHHHDTTEDGVFSVEHVMCLGACDRAPMLQCNYRFSDDTNGEYRDLRDGDGKIDMERVNKILDYWRNRERYD
ncbi:MAG: NAD(P)H-dependent oxidoreductase subunit E [Phototrophicaceae bacterium]